MFVNTPDFVFKQMLFVRFYTYFNVKVGLQIHISHQFIRKKQVQYVVFISNNKQVSYLKLTTPDDITPTKNRS